VCGVRVQEGTNLVPPHEKSLLLDLERLDRTGLLLDHCRADAKELGGLGLRCLPDGPSSRAAAVHRFLLLLLILSLISLQDHEDRGVVSELVARTTTRQTPRDATLHDATYLVAAIRCLQPLHEAVAFGHEAGHLRLGERQTTKMFRSQFFFLVFNCFLKINHKPKNNGNLVE
jgi:hypothetical protein